MVAAHRVSMPAGVETTKGRERGSLPEYHGMKRGGIGGPLERVWGAEGREPYTLKAIGLGDCEGESEV